MEFLIVQTFNSLSFGAIIFLLASGLSIIFGVMEIINMAHASYYLLGGFIALTIMGWTGNFYLAILCGIAIGALVAIAMERFFLRALEGKMMSQMLITVGFMFFFQDLCLVIWGGDPQWIKTPSSLTGNLYIHTLIFPVYRIFIIALAICVALGLWWLQGRTRFGVMLRASVDDREMAQGVGIRFPRVSMGAFVLGGGIAALSGVVGSAYLTVFPGIDFELLPYAFVVVILGGLGSLRGVVVGSIVVGLVDNFGKVLFPELSYFTLFASMAIILAVRPRGLFGRAN
jgi:branched-chain amino acid transport system permease protein